MDFSQIGPVGGPSSFPDLSQASSAPAYAVSAPVAQPSASPVSAQPLSATPFATSPTAAASPQSDTDSVADPLPPAIAAAPSPTPESIIVDTEGLPPNVRYAPSSAPHGDVGIRTFDASA